MQVTVASGVRATGTLRITTAAPWGELEAAVARIDCWMRTHAARKAYIPPWEPVEGGLILIDPERVQAIRREAQQTQSAAR